MVIYTSITHYMESATSLQDKVNKIDQVINALFDAAIKAAANENISEYTLDNGQTKINTVYKNAEQISHGIAAFQKLREQLVATLNRNTSGGAIVRLVDSKNLTGRNNCHGR